jgi:hypothetical protein
MKDYMNFFLDEEQVISASDIPDEGIDYAYMLQKEDLDYLLEVWDQYSEEWKSGICFFAGCAPLEDSLNLLIHGLNDSHEEIKFQSLCSILQSAEEELEDFGNLPSILNPLLIRRLMTEIQQSSQQHVLEDDFPEVLSALRNKSQNLL